MKSFLRTFKYSLILTLVLHDLSKCTCDKSSLDDHLNSGMPYHH